MARQSVLYTSAELAADRREDDVSRAGAFEVIAVLREHDDTARPARAAALELIAQGSASTLLTPRLGALAGSLSELIALLDWLAAAGADLVALDVGLDTATSPGQRVIAVLREVERWERRPPPGRPPRGRPGLAARAPELRERIAAMRDRGASLQSIADALNAEGVPTQRGGQHWRPSSVQAALGYRRPRPPLAGVPPAPSRPPAPPPPPERPQPGPGGARRSRPPKRSRKP